MPHTLSTSSKSILPSPSFRAFHSVTLKDMLSSSAGSVLHYGLCPPTSLMSQRGRCRYMVLLRSHNSARSGAPWRHCILHRNHSASSSINQTSACPTPLVQDSHSHSTDPCSRNVAYMATRQRASGRARIEDSPAHQQHHGCDKDDRDSDNETTTRTTATAVADGLSITNVDHDLSG